MDFISDQKQVKQKQIKDTVKLFIGYWDRNTKNFFLKINMTFIAFLLFFVILFLPTPQGLPILAHRTLAVFALTVTLWISEALPLPVTALLGCIMLALTGAVPTKDAFSAYGNDAVFFLFGAFMLGIAIMKHNLHKRIALKMLSHFGKSTTTLLIGVIATAAVLSMLIPEHAVAAMLLPVVIGILQSFGMFSLFKTNLSKSLMLGLAYGASIGSLTTFMGGARNVLAISILKESTGLSIGFFEWIIASFPVVIFTLIGAFILLIIFFPHEKKLDINKAKKEIHEEVLKLGKMDMNAKTVLAIFILAVILWATTHETLGLALVSVIAGVLLFITNSVNWKEVRDEMRWSLIFLYGGAIALGKALVSTGAAEYTSKVIVSFVGTNPYILIGILTTIAIFLTEVMSNSAATAILLPISLGIATTLNFSPKVATLLVALPAGLAFMLPISTPGNAIVHSSGYVGIKNMMKAGFIMNLIGMVVFMTIGIGYWKLIGLI